MNRQARKDRPAVFSEDYNHDIADIHNPSESLEHRMVMKHPWKLILPKEKNQPQVIHSSGGGEFINMIEGPALFNIVDDPHEKNNIASKHPEVVDELKQMIQEEWEAWEPAF